MNTLLCHRLPSRQRAVAAPSSLSGYLQNVASYTITQYGNTVYIGIAMVFVFSPYIRDIQFLLSVSSQFDF